MSEQSVRSATEKALSAANVEAATPVMGSEDVGYFSLDGKIPFVFFWLGVADPEKLATSKKTGISLPGIHSALFAPVYEPTIRTDVLAMTAAALELLER